MSELEGEQGVRQSPGLHRRRASDTPGTLAVSSPVQMCADPYLTVQETAQMLRCAAGSLYNRLCRGDLEFLRPRKVLGKWLIPVSAVQQVLDHGERRALGLVRGGQR